MGLFDKFTAKKPAEPAAPPAPPEPVVEKKPTAGGVLPLLAGAREKLKAKNLPAALAIYEEVLAGAADRADVLVTISADLGTNGYVQEMIELLAPRYDVQKHGAAAGVNLLQAYLATRNAEAAQHLLDLLFSLQRPELEARLVGFSNAIAEMFVSETEAAQAVVTENKINLVSISKPVWVYGLDAFEAGLLPQKTGRLRRLAFAQLALLGKADAQDIARQPEEEQGRLSRAVALWLAETFAYSAGAGAVATVGVMAQKHYSLVPMEWTAENLRQLNESSNGELDYIVTGALRAHHADFEIILRIWEVKKFRELKSFSARWTPVTADEALGKLHAQIRAYMEWQAVPAGNGLAYVPPAAPLAYLHALGSSLSLFLGEKEVLDAAQVATEAAPFLAAARAMPDDIRAQLMLVTALQRLQARGAAVDPVALEHARAWLSSPAAAAAGVAGVELK